MNVSVHRIAQLFFDGSAGPRPESFRGWVRKGWIELPRSRTGLVKLEARHLVALAALRVAAPRGRAAVQLVWKSIIAGLAAGARRKVPVFLLEDLQSGRLRILLGAPSLKDARRLVSLMSRFRAVRLSELEGAVAAWMEIAVLVTGTAAVEAKLSQSIPDFGQYVLSN